MGRFIYNKTINSESVSDDLLRRKDFTITNSTTDNASYHKTTAAFHPGPTRNSTSGDKTNNDHKIAYLREEINYVVDGFMKELLDYKAFSNLDPQIQSEIRSRYPQFFN
tara:strand:+ start:620 stop:946 length:327 start_codon:yes stop_codon:yes gene_type:complete